MGVLAVSPQGGLLNLVGSDGSPVAALAAMEQGGMMMLYDGEMQPRVTMLGTPAGGDLSIFAGDRQEQVHLSVSERGGRLDVCNPQGQPCARLEVNNAGSGEAQCISSANGAPVARLTMNGRGGALILDQSNGKPGIFMHGSDKGGEVALLSPDSGPTVVLAASSGAEEDRAPIVALLDAQGNNLVHIGAHDQRQYGHVVVRGPENIVFASLNAQASGGELNISNEFGISRARITTVDDGGVMTLQWAGSAGAGILATDQGGAVIVYNPDGSVRATVPAPEPSGEGETG
jgi:hypothetical protein